MLDWRRLLGAWMVAVVASACAAQRVPETAARNEAGNASRQAMLQASRQVVHLPVNVASTEAQAAASPKAAPVERVRCELGASPDALGFYASDVWPAGQVVLTFDDGPHPGATPKVLDLLAKHEMVATFFLVGRNINTKTFRLVKRMVAEGHSLASHSYNHDVDMAARQLTERTVEYIRGQHEVTQILIELALVAEDETDFEKLYQRVFDKKDGVWLSSSSLRTDWAKFSERHAEVLAERGYASADGKRPYPVLYSRPPGGGPYTADGKKAQRAIYETAMQRLGFLNVMWNGESGDANPEKKYDHGFLTGNLRHYSKKGGILLIHDYIRHDALTAALAAMAKDPAIRVVPIEDALAQKYRCASAEMREAMATLRQSRGSVASTR